MTAPVDLADIRNHLYRVAEYWWVASIVIALMTLCAAFAALWIATPIFISIAGILSLLAPIAVTWTREVASTSLLRGDKCRRLILYADGLGRDIAPEDLAQVRAWTLGARLKEAPFVKPYYSSEKSPGPQRLADIMAESAFFTEHLARKLTTGLGIVFGAALAGACLVLYSADFGSQIPLDVVLLLAKSAAVLVSFLLAGDFGLIAKKFNDLRNEAHQAFDRCARLRDTERANADEVRTVAEDYGVALLQAPPIPGWFYLIYRNALNNIYRESHLVRRQ